MFCKGLRPSLCRYLYNVVKVFQAVYSFNSIAQFVLCLWQMKLIKCFTKLNCFTGIQFMLSVSACTLLRVKYVRQWHLKRTQVVKRLVHWTMYWSRYLSTSLFRFPLATSLFTPTISAHSYRIPFSPPVYQHVYHAYSFL